MYGCITCIRFWNAISFNLTGIPEWRVLISFSGIALISAVLVFVFVKEGPYTAGTIKFKLEN